MSSDSFTEESKSLRPTVQVGDPFTEKLPTRSLVLEMFPYLKKECLIVREIPKNNWVAKPWGLNQRASNSF